jgi:intracellular multiplication protein IcmK
MIKKNPCSFNQCLALTSLILINTCAYAEGPASPHPNFGPSGSDATNQQINSMMQEALKDPKAHAMMAEVNEKLKTAQKNQEPDPLPDEPSPSSAELANLRAQYNQSMAATQKNPESIDNEAFNALLHEALPLSPKQIRTLRKLYDLSQQAVAAPPKAPPTPTSSSTVISLQPGATPPIIRLSAGFISSLVFVDVTGAPWPITAYSIGDPNSFNIQWDQKTNNLFVQAMKSYCHGNIAVRLFGLNTPVMISLVSGQREVDFRVDLQVSGRGPNAIEEIITNSFQDSKINPILIHLLDGIPPKGSVKLSVSDGHGEAWVFHNKLYFRTKLTVLSPAWLATVSSPDGTHVYEMAKTPLILASKCGKSINVYLMGL